MPKSKGRKRKKKKPQIVYSHQRERKQSKGPTPEGDQMPKHIRGLVEHSEEVIKLKIESNHTRNKIAMLARNRDTMDHFISDEKEHIIWFANKIDEHIKACIVFMERILGDAAQEYQLPEDFCLGSADLKNGYVTIENKKEKEMTVILSDTPAEFPNDLVTIGTIIPYDEKVLNDLKVESLLKNKDVISTILLRKASILEDSKTGIPWHCSSVSCLVRKPKINFEDL